MGSAHSTDAAAAPVPEPEPAAASVPAPARLITADDVFNAAHTCTNEMMKMMQ